MNVARFRSCTATAIVTLATVVAGRSVAWAGDAKGPVKVFILAGQSNMQGHGSLASVDWLGKDPKHGRLLSRLKKNDGAWTVRDDVWIHYQRDAKTLKKGNLTAGFGAGDVGSPGVPRIPAHRRCQREAIGCADDGEHRGRPSARSGHSDFDVRNAGGRRALAG